MRSIRLRLIALYVCLVTTVLGLSGAYAQWKLRESLTDGDAQMRHRVITRLGISLPSALWNLDHAKVSSLLDAELQDPGVTAIRVYDAPNSIFVARTRADGKNLSDLPNDRQPVGKAMPVKLVFMSNNRDQYPVGEAVVFFDTSLTELALNNEIRRRIIEVVVVDLVLIAALASSLRMVFTPLRRLRDALWKLATVDPESIRELSTRSGDELSEVAQGFNRILAKFKAAIEATRKAQEEARKASESTLVAYENLKQAQDSLVEAERLASLGGLVAGVAHEINTPVGVTLTSASVLAETTDKVRQQLEQGGLRKSEVLSYFDIASESAQLIMSNASRAAQLIHSFKQIAVDQTSEARRAFNILQYVDEIVLSLSPRIKKTAVTISVDCPSDLEIDSYPGAFAQILTNLIINALIHAFPEGRNGSIAIHVTRSDKLVEVLFQDDGVGIAPHDLSRIFDPFFTTRRGSGGSGLGLHIVYNLMVQRFGGTIDAHSEVGKGTRFLLRFPLMAPAKEAS